MHNGDGREKYRFGKDDGEEDVTLKPGQMPSHKHKLDNFKFVEEGNLLKDDNKGIYDFVHRDYAWWSIWNEGLGLPKDGYGFGIPLDKVGRLQDAATWRGGMIPSHSNDFGGGQSHNNMPPYYVLAYIMKL